MVERRRRLPGDKSPQNSNIESMIRVNHAGEYGARRIYQGQIKALSHDAETVALIQHMAEQEDVHLAYFEEQLSIRGVRPTALKPLWHVAGYALGYVTGKMGKRAAMACTVAVESVISDHYGAQITELKNGETKEVDLLKTIERFKAEEEEHHNIGIEHDAELTKGYKALSTVISGGSKLAIAVAKKI